MTLVRDNAVIIAGLRDELLGFDIFKDTFRDDLQDFRERDIRTIGRDKAAQRTVIRFNSLFQLADGVGGEIDRFGGDGIIITVGRGRLGAKRNDISELVCSGGESAAELAGVRVGLEKLFDGLSFQGVVRGWRRESKEMGEGKMDCEEEE